MQTNINCTRNIFEDKLAIDKINYNDILNGQIKCPNYQQGESNLTIIKYKSEVMYGSYSSNVKAEFIFEDDFGNEFAQVYFLKNGKNNNLGKFIYEVLGYAPDGEFSLKELEGKRITATIAHYYNEIGVGYANIAFCEPA